MTEIKSHEFEGFLQTGARRHRLFVVYGPDRGLVSERAGQLAAASGVDLSDPFSLVKLDVGDLHNDAGRLVDEVNSIGLFGGGRLVWIRGAANEKSVVDGLQAIAADPPETASLIIEAGDLKKTAALRKLAD